MRKQSSAARFASRWGYGRCTSAKGLHRQGPGVDLDAALQAMVQTSTLPRPRAPEWAQRDWSAYERFAYIPLDRISNESVSKTLELDIGDDAAARLGRADPDDARQGQRRPLA